MADIIHSRILVGEDGVMFEIFNITKNMSDLSEQLEDLMTNLRTTIQTFFYTINQYNKIDEENENNPLCKERQQKAN